MTHPPVVRLTRDPIELESVVEAVNDPGCGAVVTFVGTVRDHHHGRAVLRLEYSAYEAMACSEMEQIGTLLQDRWPIYRVAIVHRLGTLEIGEASIAIAISLAHRKEGFEALQFAVDKFKESVPIWKKEYFADGEAEWVHGS